MLKTERRKMIDVLLLGFIIFLFFRLTSLEEELLFLNKRQSDLASRICNNEADLNQAEKKLRNLNLLLKEKNSNENLSQR